MVKIPDVKQFVIKKIDDEETKEIVSSMIDYFMNKTDNSEKINKNNWIISLYKLLIKFCMKKMETDNPQIACVILLLTLLLIKLFMRRK